MDLDVDRDVLTKVKTNAEDGIEAALVSERTLATACQVGPVGLRIFSGLVLNTTPIPKIAH